jgi:hypothetical protein
MGRPTTGHPAIVHRCMVLTKRHPVCASTHRSGISTCELGCWVGDDLDVTLVGFVARVRLLSRMSTVEGLPAFGGGTSKPVVGAVNIWPTV